MSRLCARCLDGDHQHMAFPDGAIAECPLQLIPGNIEVPCECPWRSDAPVGRPDRTPIDFGDLLVAVATDLDDIRQCVGCGEDSTWAGLFVADDGVVHVTAWCDAPACEHDRTVLSTDSTLALPIDHLPALRRPHLDTQENR